MADMVPCSCEYCEIEFFLHESEVIRGRGRYCSRSCMAKSYSVVRVKIDRESSLDEYFWESMYE